MAIERIGLQPILQNSKIIGTPNDGPKFAETLQNALNQVNQDQLNVEQMQRKMITGEVNDISEVMIAAEKANLSLGLTVQVRNKVVEAYQEIMRMQI